MANKKTFNLLLGGLSTLLFVGKAYAMCPLCTVVVGAGVIAAEDSGVDNTIIGIWVGALTVSIIGWTINWMNKRKYNFKGMEILVTLIYFLLLPFSLFLLGHYPELFPKYLQLKNTHSMTLWGVDKMILGMIVGSIGFYGFASWYEVMKKNNNNKAYFPFQRVVMPVVGLIILSGIFYFLTRG